MFTSVAEDRDGDTLIEGHTIVTFEDLGAKTKITIQASAVAIVPIAEDMLKGMEAGWTEAWRSWKRLCRKADQHRTLEQSNMERILLCRDLRRRSRFRTGGGNFLAFSTFVMGALGRLPQSAGISAMQSINVVVINPVFLSVFMGTAILCIVLTIAALIGWSPRIALSHRRQLSLFCGLLPGHDGLQRTAQ